MYFCLGKRDIKCVEAYPWSMTEKQHAWLIGLFTYYNNSSCWFILRSFLLRYEMSLNNFINEGIKIQIYCLKQTPSAKIPFIGRFTGTYILSVAGQAMLIRHFYNGCKVVSVHLSGAALPPASWAAAFWTLPLMPNASRTSLLTHYEFHGHYNKDMF